MNSTSAADVIIQALCPGPDVVVSALGAPFVTYASRSATRVARSGPAAAGAAAGGAAGAAAGAGAAAAGAAGGSAAVAVDAIPAASIATTSVRGTTAASFLWVRFMGSDPRERSRARKFEMRLADQI